MRGTLARGGADLTGCTVLAIFAHPDDESLACGGTLARLSDLGASVVLLCASRGELGTLADASSMPPADLARVRTGELRAAANALGLSEVVLLDHPDGSLRWANADALRADITHTLHRYKPDVVITFDDDGLYWHADHVGIHERTLDAVAELGAAAPALYFVTIAAGAMSHLVHRAEEKHWAHPASGFWGIDPAAFGVGARPSTLVVDTRAVMARKLAALQCHRSQMGAVNPFSLMTEAEAVEWLGFERFRRASSVHDAPGILERLAEAGPLAATA